LTATLLPLFPSTISLSQSICLIQTSLSTSLPSASRCPDCTGTSGGGVWPIFSVVRCLTSLASAPKFCAEINAAAVASEVHRPPSSEKHSLPHNPRRGLQAPPRPRNLRRAQLLLAEGISSTSLPTRPCSSATLAWPLSNAPIASPSQKRVAIADSCPQHRSAVATTTTPRLLRAADVSVFAKLALPTYFPILSSTVWTPTVDALRLKPFRL
jgi:hypothetical protein